MDYGNDLLIRVLMEPNQLRNYGSLQWDTLVRQAKRNGLLGRIQFLITEHQHFTDIPSRVQAHLQSARVIAENEQRVMRWEINRICRALEGIDAPVVLLKGAAYMMMELPVARGRISTDVDILVPREALNEVEEALLTHGWEHVKLEDYDQYFYRHWSHELPPLVHRDRGTVVDVHHTILPPTGRLHPDPEKLLTTSVPLAGTRFNVPAPVDMVLHSAAHAFQDGDLKRGLRDLVDIDDLLRHFGQANGFWDKLISRAKDLQLTRPLFYGFRYSRRFLNAPVPDFVWREVRRWRPPWPVLPAMDALVERALDPGRPSGKSRPTRFSLSLLYIRSHWLRMPPWLLAKHLLRQTLRRWRPGKQA